MNKLIKFKIILQIIKFNQQQKIKINKMINKLIWKN